MASKTLPNIGLKGGYGLGDDGWGDEQNANLLKLSVLVQGGIIGRVAAVPVNPAPAEGDAYVLTAEPNANAVAVFTSGAWSYFTPIEGWLFYDRGANKYVSFDGAAWAELATGSAGSGGGGGGGGDGIDDAPVDGQEYVRKDGNWKLNKGIGEATGHRYWRISKMRTLPNNGPYINTARFYYGAQGVSTAGVALTPSSTYQGESSGFRSSNLIDGDDETGWAATDGDPFMVFQFPSAVKINRVLLRGNNSEQTLRSFDWAYSDDGETWTKVTSAVEPDPAQSGSDVTRTYDFSAFDAGLTQGPVYEAPNDGKSYVRKNGAWVEAPSSGGGGGAAYSGCRYTRSASTGNIGNDAEYNILNNDALQDHDIGGWYTGDGNFVVPSGVSVIAVSVGLQEQWNNNFGLRVYRRRAGADMLFLVNGDGDKFVKTASSGPLSVQPGDIIRPRFYNGNTNTFPESTFTFVAIQALA